MRRIILIFLSAAIVAGSLCSCGGQAVDVAKDIAEEVLPYETIKNSSLYSTIVIDGEIFRIAGEEDGQRIKDEYTVGQSLMLGDNAEYLIADENGVPYDDEKVETDAYYLGEKKDYVFMPGLALVWVKENW